MTTSVTTSVNTFVKTFYRVSHRETGQGLWYDTTGNFTGLIHNELSFCKNRDLPMDFDPAIVGFVSVVETLEQLYQWFTPDDIEALQELGWFAAEYQSDDYRWYERFGHYVANGATLTKIRTITLESSRVIPGVPASAGALAALVRRLNAENADLRKALEAKQRPALTTAKGEPVYISIGSGGTERKMIHAEG